MLTRAFSIVGLALLFPAAVLAASFTINPVRVELAGARPYAVMKIMNMADTPVTLHARAYAWTGDETKGGLSPTDDVIMNPPVFTIAPKATRFLRLGLRAANRGTAELTYRLIVEEVPKAVDPTEGAAIHTILRLSVPIFALPKSPVAPKLEWALQDAAPGKLKLTVANKGNAHVQIRELNIAPAEKTITPKNLNAPVYVLQGQSHEWEVEATDFAGESRMKVVANTDAGKSEEIVGTTPLGVVTHPN